MRDCAKLKAESQVFLTINRLCMHPQEPTPTTDSAWHPRINMWTASALDNRHPTTNIKQLALTNATNKQTKHPDNTLYIRKKIFERNSQKSYNITTFAKITLSVFCKKKYNFPFIGPNVEADNNRTITSLHISLVDKTKLPFEIT
jgi:hypothetical protein